jgi:hypothetical protein
MSNPDIPEYMALQAERSRLRERIKRILERDLASLLSDYDSRLEDEIKNLPSDRLLTSSDFKKLIEDYTAELIRKGNLSLSFGRQEIIDLQNDVKQALNYRYPIDYSILPKVNADSYSIRREFQTIIESYRSGRLSEHDMRRALRGRMHQPANVINTVINTQLAGFDNSSSRTVGLLAGLESFVYMGPLGPHTRPFCKDLLLDRRLWTEPEILGMDNGQGLPVDRYCGGYNCLHHWAMVSSAWSEVQKWLKAA